MEDAPADFLTQFHNLKGDLINERRKNLFKLLSNPSISSDGELLDSTLKKLQPKTYLESIFRIDALIYFRKTTELLNILKESNEVFTKKIIKRQWVFEEALKDIDAGKFVNEFLPSVSYALRMKILRRVAKSWNERQVDELFDNLYNRYGLRIATIVVHKCSAEKIGTVLDENEIKLQPYQVKYLFDKNWRLFRKYLVSYMNINAMHKKSLSSYVATKNLTLWLELQEEGRLCATVLSRYTSGKVVDLFKDEILKDFYKYSKCLNKKILVKKLGNDFKIVYAQLFPKKMSSISMYNECNQLILFYPENKRWELFSATFSLVHSDINIQNVFTTLGYSIFNFHPPKDIVQKWAEANYNATYDISFLKYVLPPKSVPLLREKINVTSGIDKRRNLVHLMVESCAENEDVAYLVRVLKYVCYRHRNEDSSFRPAFLNLLRSHFNLEDFDETHWTYVNEQIELGKVQQDISLHLYAPFVEHYFDFLLKSDKPYEEKLVVHVTDIFEHHHRLQFDLKNPEDVAKWLTETIRIMPQIASDDYDRRWCKIICTVISFSIKNPQYCFILTEYPVFVKYINKFFDKAAEFARFQAELVENVLLYNITFPQNPVRLENSKILDVFLYVFENRKFCLMYIVARMVAKNNRSELENKLLEMYFEKMFSVYPMENIVTWILKNEPSYLLPYFEDIVRINLKIKLFNCKDLKLYSHFDFDKKAITYYKQINDYWNDEPASNEYRQINYSGCVKDKKLEIIQHLSILLPTAEFAQIINEFFVPKADEQKKQDHEIIKLLHKVSEPTKMLHAVLDFCTGSYLQSALRALYSVFHRLPQHQVNTHLIALSERPAIVKKHVIFLSCELLDRHHVINLLKSSTGSDIFSRRYLFFATLKYFLKTPSQELFDLVIEKLFMVDKNEKTLNKLKNIKVPVKYRAVFTEKLWKFYVSEDGNIKIETYLDSLLDSLNSSVDTVTFLQPSFIEKVINDHFNETRSNLSSVNLFLLNVLKYRKSEQTKNFSLIFEKISQFSYKHIRIFFEDFHDFARSVYKTFFDLFKSYWSKYFTLIDTFEEYISMKFLELDYVYPELQDLAKNVVVYMEQLISEYGFHVTHQFEKKLHSHLVHKCELDKYLFLRKVLEIQRTPITCILVLNQIKEISEHQEDLFKVYRDILELVKNVNEPIVQVEYKLFLSN